MDKLNEPIEYICAHYSTEGLYALLPFLKCEYNVAAVMDELTMRIPQELSETEEEYPDWNWRGIS